jgi:NADH-quinone oxidoreductase subunit J
MIGVYFVAAIQLIVYAGAIMVLFVFSIMLLNYNEMKREINFKSPIVWLSLGSAVVLSITMICLFKTPFLPLVNAIKGTLTDDFVKAEGGNIMVLSKLLFSQYALHFEMISLVLLVALIGALTVAKRKVD